MRFRLLVLSILFCCNCAHAGDIPGQSWHDLQLDKLDQPAPQFDTGSGKTLADYHGQWVIMHFWATWCGPCMHELPALNNLYIRWHNHHVAFFAISIDTDSAADVAGFVRKLGLQLPLLLSGEMHTPERYWSWGVPATYLVNPEGRLVARALGPRAWDSVAGDALLAALTADEHPDRDQDAGLQNQ
jgi:thiol-disulfide isomerase/thioredoxin